MTEPSQNDLYFRPAARRGNPACSCHDHSVIARLDNTRESIRGVPLVSTHTPCAVHTAGAQLVPGSAYMETKEAQIEDLLRKDKRRSANDMLANLTPVAAYTILKCLWHRGKLAAAQHEDTVVRQLYEGACHWYWLNDVSNENNA